MKCARVLVRAVLALLAAALVSMADAQPLSSSSSESLPLLSSSSSGLSSSSSLPLSALSSSSLLLSSSSLSSVLLSSTSSTGLSSSSAISSSAISSSPSSSSLYLAPSPSSSSSSSSSSLLNPFTSSSSSSNSVVVSSSSSSFTGSGTLLSSSATPTSSASPSSLSSSSSSSSSGTSGPLGACAYDGPFPSPSVAMSFYFRPTQVIDFNTGTYLLVDISNFFLASDGIRNLYNPGTLQSLQCGSITPLMSSRRRLLQSTSSETYRVSIYFVSIANSDSLAQEFSQTLFRNGFNGSNSGIVAPSNQIATLAVPCGGGVTAQIGTQCPVLTDSGSTSSNLSNGAIAGIAVGSAVGAVLLCLGVAVGMWFCQKQSKSRRRARHQATAMPTALPITSPHSHAHLSSQQFAPPVLPTNSPVSPSSPYSYSYDVEPDVYTVEKVDVEPRAVAMFTTTSPRSFQYGTSTITRPSSNSAPPLGLTIDTFPQQSQGTIPPASYASTMYRGIIHSPVNRGTEPSLSEDGVSHHYQPTVAVHE